jgi:type IV secretory pathway TraG/TraD family ATPase VirD4
MNTNLRTLEKYRNWQDAIIGTAFTLPILLGSSLFINHKLGIAINELTVSTQAKILWRTKDFGRYVDFLSAHPIDSIKFYALPVSALALGLWVSGHYFRLIDPAIHIRGRRFLTGKRAVKDANFSQNDAIKSTGFGVNVGSVKISRQKQLQSFLIMGAQGGGKTVVINSLLSQAIEKNEKTIIFDLTKGDFTRWVPEFVMLSPTDSRTSHWWLGFDLLDLGDASTFAESMIPPGDDPFWSSVAQNILISIIIKLQTEKGKNWSWPHLAKLIFESEIEDLKEYSEKFYAPAKDSIADAESKMTISIIVTLRSFCSPIFRMAVMAVKINKNCFSIVSFLNNDESTTRNLIIQGDKKDSALSAALARAIVNLATKHISSLQFEESSKRKIGFFLDELPQAGKLDDIASLLEIGRSKGIYAVLGFQDISQVNQIYGKDEAQKWGALTGVKIFPKVQGSQSQRFVSDELGEKEIEFKSKSVSIQQGGGKSTSTSMQRQTLPVLANSQLESDFGPGKKGVDALLIGIGGSALKLHFKFADYPKIRKSWVGWSDFDRAEMAKKIKQEADEREILRQKNEQDYQQNKSNSLADFDLLLSPIVVEIETVSPVEIPSNEVVEKIAEPAEVEILAGVLGIDSHLIEAVGAVLEVGEAINSTEVSTVEIPTNEQKFRRRIRKNNIEKEL